MLALYVERDGAAFTCYGIVLMLSRSPQSLPSLPEQVARELADGIMRSEIVPGESLREVPLASLFGVSRSTVREALRILERDGVVTIRPRHGAKVTVLNPAEMVEIYQIRAGLLGVACRLFSADCTGADCDWLDERLARMAQAQGDSEEARALIHAELSASMANYITGHSGNKKLAELLQQMSMQIARYTKLGLSSEARRRQSIENWQSLLAACRANDTSRANELGQKLVQDNLGYALQVLASDVT